jgi:hypothetical protein
MSQQGATLAAGGADTYPTSQSRPSTSSSMR